MKINGEEVEPVTDFASLRAGMIVWATKCGACNGPHRLFLLKPTTRKIALNPPGAKGWEYLPNVHRTEGCIAPSSVAMGSVYRVVDPLLDAKPVTLAKELQRG